MPEHPFCFTPTRRYCGVGPLVKFFSRPTAAGVYIYIHYKSSMLTNRTTIDRDQSVCFTSVNAAFLNRKREPVLAFAELLAACLTTAPIDICVIVKLGKKVVVGLTR